MSTTRLDLIAVPLQVATNCDYLEDCQEIDFCKQNQAQRNSPRILSQTERLYSPQEHIEWDLALSPASPQHPILSEASTIPVFRQPKTSCADGGIGTRKIPSFYGSGRVVDNRRGHYQSTDSMLFESLGSNCWPVQLQKSKPSSFLHHGGSGPLLERGGDDTPFNAKVAMPLNPLEGHLTSPTFGDVSKRSWVGGLHSRQPSSTSPRLITGSHAPLSFMSPQSPAAPIDYGSLLVIDFASPTHSSVSGGLAQHQLNSCVPPALFDKGTLVPPFNHWDAIGYLSLGDRHGVTSYHQRLEALMSPMPIHDGPVLSPFSDPALPQIYYSANCNPLFVMSGAECLLAPKEQPLMPPASAMSPTTERTDSSSQASTHAALSRTQPAAIIFDDMTSPLGEAQAMDLRHPTLGMKVPLVISKECLFSGEITEGGHTDASSQRSASTPSSNGGGAPGLGNADLFTPYICHPK